MTEAGAAPGGGAGRPSTGTLLSKLLAPDGQAAGGGLEDHFDASFATQLALREKQIQQNYRPVIGIHKWFARRPGAIFRSLLLAEYGRGPLREAFWQPHGLSGVIADPFMGGGTPVFEANRLGFDVVGCDINPMAHWIVRQSLSPLDIGAFTAEAEAVAADMQADIGGLYQTACGSCGQDAPVKYFLWVKTMPCPACGADNDLFPGYRLAEAGRHPRHVLACGHCGTLNEYEQAPTSEEPGQCSGCGGEVRPQGNVRKRKLSCHSCGHDFSVGAFSQPPKHRMWALEYRCASCYGRQPGRQFKKPDEADLARVEQARRRLEKARADLPIPEDAIPPGDESDRLHRWGYSHYHQMFGERQLLGLGLLLRRIRAVQHAPVRHALLTVFSDSLRYQNMVCRYDTQALKCQDIFSVHGFPVGLVQCENNLLGIPKAGSGAFRHFVEKYVRAKRYCQQPFETFRDGAKKALVAVEGETIEADLVQAPPAGAAGKGRKLAFLANAPSQTVGIAPETLDGVFTDPPYFDNVQYAELMDFCYAWLRQALAGEFASFAGRSTRSDDELTGNATLGRGIQHFTDGMSQVFRHFATGLKPGRPFVFTYHHNDPAAYLPLAVAMLDADLECTATLPAAAEMAASLHIAGTSSSVLDSVFVCRKPVPGQVREVHVPPSVAGECREALARDASAMAGAGLRVRTGDLRCLLAGHIARIAVRTLAPSWDTTGSLEYRIAAVQGCLESIHALAEPDETVALVLEQLQDGAPKPRRGP